jgi:hypothetical protein
MMGDEQLHGMHCLGVDEELDYFTPSEFPLHPIDPLCIIKVVEFVREIRARGICPGQ